MFLTLKQAADLAGVEPRQIHARIQIGELHLGNRCKTFGGLSLKWPGAKRQVSQLFLSCGDLSRAPIGNIF